jgi:hypothetical protein
MGSVAAHQFNANGIPTDSDANIMAMPPRPDRLDTKQQPRSGGTSNKAGYGFVPKTTQSAGRRQTSVFPHSRPQVSLSEGDRGATVQADELTIACVATRSCGCQRAPRSHCRHCARAPGRGPRGKAIVRVMLAFRRFQNRRRRRGWSEAPKAAPFARPDQCVTHSTATPTRGSRRPAMMTARSPSSLTRLAASARQAPWARRRRARRWPAR